MSDAQIWTVLGIAFVSLMLIMIGIQKLSDAIRNRSAQRKIEKAPSQPESLAERFKTKE